MSNKPVIWEAMLDGRYDCKVLRDDAYHGRLVIADSHDEDRVLYCEQVSLLYGAQFGPDIDDIASWEKKVLEFIDGDGQ